MRAALVSLAALTGLVVPVHAAGARAVYCEVGDREVHFTSQHTDFERVEPFETKNESSKPIRYEWVVSKRESRTWSVGGTVEGGADWLFGHVKAEVNTNVARSMETSTEDHVGGELAPHSTIRGAYGFGIQHFGGNVDYCRGGKFDPRTREYFEGSAPTGHIFVVYD